MKRLALTFIFIFNCFWMLGQMLKPVVGFPQKDKNGRIYEFIYELTLPDKHQHASVYLMYKNKNDTEYKTAISVSGDVGDNVRQGVRSRILWEVYKDEVGLTEPTFWINIIPHREHIVEWCPTIRVGFGGAGTITAPSFLDEIYKEGEAKTNIRPGYNDMPSNLMFSHKNGRDHVSLSIGYYNSVNKIKISNNDTTITDLLAYSSAITYGKTFWPSRKLSLSWHLGLGIVIYTKREAATLREMTLDDNKKRTWAFTAPIEIVGKYKINDWVSVGFVQTNLITLHNITFGVGGYLGISIPNRAIAATWKGFDTFKKELNPR